MPQPIFKFDYFRHGNPAREQISGLWLPIPVNALVI